LTVTVIVAATTPAATRYRATVDHHVLSPSIFDTRLTSRPTGIGGPPTAAAVKKLVLTMAKDNAMRGHRRILRRVVNLGHQIAPSTVWEILYAARVDPAPRRSGPTWKQFLTAHAYLAEVTANPTGEWTTQAARNTLMDLAERDKKFKFLIRDRDTKFTDRFDAAFADAGIRILCRPPRAPRADAICEKTIAGATTGTAPDADH
jgi:hypothetical protein